ncbi:MAG: Gfo/Idh/MocA family oxidoreductase [Gemmatimonadales bacterium]|nr:Gfo/Idh/MocA family oxidoreductase [Gemmatimonadales bacterium]NIQ98775.1 Gfo/Idh/MocA family oxidoreductase [Gemmatimonadales bacterium]
MIGTGIIGFYNIRSALTVPGVELAAVCDLYDGRLTRAKEVFGQEITATRDYREILGRDDIDVVLIATPDHWHDVISIDAMRAGKAVYCEKPMVQEVAEGHRVIAAERRHNAKFQVGSQGVSSIVMKKAQELYRAGAIGDLIVVEAVNDRHSSLGAWQYSIPPDASPQTVDFDRFLGDTPRVPFDPVRFFRWRNYRAYGTGIAGDLFVHLFSWLHWVISSDGPTKIYGSGGLRYWEDGRDVPDVLTCVVDYPEAATHPPFNLQIRVNFVAGGARGSSLTLVGSEGTLGLAGDSVTLSRTPFPAKPGYGGYDSFSTFPKDVQDEFARQYRLKYYDVPPSIREPSEVIYTAPERYDDRDDHWANLIAAVRDGKTIVEDATYGLRAAGPSLAANESYFNNRIITWDHQKLEYS